MKKLLWITALLLFSAGGFLAYDKLIKKPAVQILETAKVERGDIRGVLVETGIIKPQVGAVVKIGSRITGTITQMNVKIGDRVSKGDLIALLDDRELKKSIERQRAALQSARNTLTQTEMTYPERIKEALASFQYARINYDRERELLKHEYTTGDAVDKARSQFQATEANVRRLREEHKTQLEIAKATVQEITAQIRQIEVTLSYTRIYAPIDGLISEVTAQEGETIVTGLQVANLVTVLDPTRLEMWIYVDETDIGRVTTGLDTEYYVDTFPDRVFKGPIGRVNPQPVSKDNIVYYLATVEIPQDDATVLRPEMTTHVKIVFEEKKDILTAPNAAVKFEEGKQIVYKVVGRDEVDKTEIKIGTRGEDRTEILSGLTDGDELATKIVLPVAAKP